MTSATAGKRSHALAGLLAGAVALATGELVAGVAGRRRSPVIAVGDRFIEYVPRQVKDLAIEMFGTGDKAALLIGIYGVAAVFAAAIGVLASRRFALAAVALAAFGGVGAVSRAPVGSLAAAVAGIVALRVLSAAVPTTPKTTARYDRDRRDFLRLAVAAGAAATTAGAVGRFLQNQVSATASRLGVSLPRPRHPLPRIPSDADFAVKGLSPFMTPNEDFYRIDVNLVVPQVKAETWSLRVHGMVDRELVIDFDELLARDLVEEDITIACVSNEIGGELVGNARWLGAPLLPLLEEAGIAAGVDQVVGRAVDGFTTGFPLDALREERPALVAVGMNGEPLPVRNGFPARLVVAGLYGYVSATKWLKEIELTRFADFDQYWVKRGWSDRGPIKTMARIDTPNGFKRLQAGQVVIAGVAWAPTRGIARVEVQVDDNPWQDAQLAAEVTKQTWRQWRLVWDAEPGEHRLRVRATDGSGDLQVETRSDPFPDGATGWHGVRVRVA